MPQDFLEGLKAKEEEMAAVIEDARVKATAIIESAVRQAKEIKTVKMIEADSLIRASGADEDALMMKEAKEIEAGAAEAVKALLADGSLMLSAAVAEVVKTVSGTDDKIT